MGNERYPTYRSLAWDSGSAHKYRTVGIHDSNWSKPRVLAVVRVERGKRVICHGCKECATENNIAVTVRVYPTLKGKVYVPLCRDCADAWYSEEREED